MKALWLSVATTVAGIAASSPSCKIDSAELQNAWSYDFSNVYKKYAPQIKAEIQTMENVEAEFSGRPSSMAKASASNGDFRINDLAEFEKSLPDGKPFYVGHVVLDELTPRVASALGEKINNWIPNSSADYAKFILKYLEEGTLLSFRISETNLFEGLNIQDGKL